MQIYVVTAYRFGNREKHSYVLGVYSTEELALQEADKEENFRGGKYTCEILMYILDSEQSPDLSFNLPKVIKKLPYPSI